MCDTCGCTPSTGGDKVEEENCAGCGKPAVECDCPKEEVPGAPEDTIM